MGRQSTLYGHVWDGRALWLAGLMENFRPSTLTFAGEGECSQLDSMTSIPQKPPNEDSKCLAKPLQVPGKRQVSAWQVPGDAHGRRMAYPAKGLVEWRENPPLSKS